MWVRRKELEESEAREGAGRVQVMCRLAAALVGLPDGLYRNTEWRTQCHRSC